MRSSLEDYKWWKNSLLHAGNMNKKNLDYTFSKDLIRFVLFEYYPHLDWEPTDEFKNSDDNSFTAVVKLTLKHYLDTTENIFSHQLYVTFMEGKDCLIAHEILCQYFRRMFLSKPVSCKSFLEYLCVVSKSTAYTYCISDTVAPLISLCSIYKTIVSMRQQQMLSDSFWNEFALQCEYEVIFGTLCKSASIRHFLLPIFEENYIESIYKSTVEGYCRLRKNRN
ncbi:hypothetical protein NPIL_2691 [Nephila pilipes]|uniref:Uncharacterized protein n=1 Tax=Nephila pilipes TaxID=299642 RepID=A0A8X6TPM2_NEPPI|nr:hypothetical protein NPIL_2691 [Nephila pilipes]